MTRTSSSFPYHRSSAPDGVLIKRCSEMFRKFIEEKLCKNVISIKMQCNFIEITLRREYNKNTSGRLLELVTPKQPTSKYLAN